MATVSARTIFISLQSLSAPCPLGIRINAVCPGTISTPMVENMLRSGDLREADAVKAMPINRLGKASEVSDAVLWLCSDMASFVIGQSIAVDGGYTIV